MAKKTDTPADEEALVAEVMDDLQGLIHGRPAPERRTLSTGIPLLDLALGGGWPLSKGVEVFGPENEGKSLLCALACREAQKAGGRAYYFANEPDFDPTWLRILGVAVEGTMSRPVIPNSLEEATKAVEGMVKTLWKSGKPTVIVLDPLVIASEADHEKDMDKTGGVAEEARVLSRFFRRPTLRRMWGSNILLLWTSQVRDNVGVMFGNKETTPGGRAVRHAAAIRLRVRRSTSIKSGEVETGFFLEIRVVKTKVSTTSGAVVRVPFFFGSGVDNALSLIYWLIDHGHIPEESKGWVAWAGRKWRKMDLRDAMLEDPKLYTAILEEVRGAWRP